MLHYRNASIFLVLTVECELIDAILSKAKAKASEVFDSQAFVLKDCLNKLCVVLHKHFTFCL